MYHENSKKGKLLGIAADFYRLRALKVHEELPSDLEWQEDILYRSPKAYPSKLKVTYRIQVITQDKTVYEIANLSNRKEAKSRLKKIEEDMRELSKTKFDEKYRICDTSDYGKNMANNTNTGRNTNITLPNTIYFTGFKDTSSKTNN